MQTEVGASRNMRQWPRTTILQNGFTANAKRDPVSLIPILSCTFRELIYKIEWTHKCARRVLYIAFHCH